MNVLLLHALPLDGRAWDDVADHLDHEVIAPTLYGLGDSVEDWADACLALCGSGPLVVVGNSVGGSCGIEIALRAPRQVQHLVLVGAKAGHRLEPARRDEAIRLLRDDGVMAAWSRYWEPLISPTAGDEVRTRLADLAQQQRVEDLVRGVSAFHARPDRAAALRTWPGPVTLVVGEHDIAPDRAAQTARSLPDGALVQLRGVGHYAPLEAPEQLARVLSGTDLHAGRRPDHVAGPLGVVEQRT